MSKPLPEGWPRLSSSLFYDDAAAAIDFLCRAFGFEIRLKIEGDDGKIVHSELVFRDALVMISSTGRRPFYKSPRSAGGCTQALLVFVDDVDAHCAKAKSAGAEIFEPPADHDYGPEYWTDRLYGAIDLEGHHWWFTQRMRDPK